MACPFYQRAESRCQLLDSVVASIEEDRDDLAPVEEVRVAICRGSSYRRCPAYREHVSERRSSQ